MDRSKMVIDLGLVDLKGKVGDFFQKTTYLEMASHHVKKT